MSKADIATTLSNILDERDMTVSELSRGVNLPAQTLYSILRNPTQRPAFDTVERICRYLRVPLETFASNEVIQPEIIPFWVELSDQNRHKLIGYAQCLLDSQSGTKSSRVDLLVAARGGKIIEAGGEIGRQISAVSDALAQADEDEEAPGNDS